MEVQDQQHLYEPSLSFLHTLERLKNIPRAGWVKRGVRSPESVSDHSFRMVVLCLMLKATDVDKEKCIRMAAYHDMGEAIIGDITPSDGVSKEDKHLRERLAIQFLSALNQPGNMAFAVELESVWKEYEEGKTKEAQLVRDIDVYERLVQAKEYEVRERGEKDLGDFFVQWEEIITTSEIKRWTEFLLRERETFWSRKKASAVIIFVLGGPGVGKGTQCAQLAQDLKFQHLSVGDLLREEIDRLGSPFASFINESIQSSVIIPAQLTVNLLKTKMNVSKTQGKSRFLIDGYPRSMDQAVMFEEEIQDSNSAILLECSDDEMLRRLRKRAESSKRIDDNPDAFKKRLDTYQKESLPVVDHLGGSGKEGWPFAILDDFSITEGDHKIFTTLRSTKPFLEVQTLAIALD
ncbi:MAG: HD domain-containing protein 2 [Heterodermia speciosa]|uniref:5'-deoxynucleotidase n=1 Tax=Heterodermia speciosa TaxID=116794 RepID=A0A8H3PEL3_9LECA|nr:MAG: HD domain-containing protein 2 [Heterodermia speciosa]